MDTAEEDMPNAFTCAHKWVRMSDANCRSAVAWYRSCAQLAGTLRGAERDEYTTSLIENIKLSYDDYFRKSEGSLTTRSIVEKDMGRIVEALMFPSHLAKQIRIEMDARGKFQTAGESMSCAWALDNHILLQAIWIVGFLTVFMTIVILGIMMMVCIRYTKYRGKNNLEDSCLDFVNQKMQCQCGSQKAPTRRVWDTADKRHSPTNKHKVAFAESESDEYDDPRDHVGIRFTTVDYTRQTEDHKAVTKNPMRKNPN